MTARRALASLVTFSLPSPHNPLRYSVLCSHPPSPLYGRVSTRSTPYRRPHATRWMERTEERRERKTPGSGAGTKIINEMSMKDRMLLG